MAKRRKGIRPLKLISARYTREILELYGRTFGIPAREALEAGGPAAVQAVLRDIEQLVAADPAWAVEEASVAVAAMAAHQRRAFQQVMKSVTVNVGIFKPALGGVVKPALEGVVKPVTVNVGIFGGASDLAVKPVLEAALRENVRLIKNLAVQYGDRAYDDITQIITETGFDLEAQRAQIAKYLSKDGSSGRYLSNRAKLIARDQNNKITGALNQTRHQSVGGKRYAWDASMDERTRHSHRFLNDSEQDWSEPPMGGGTTASESGHPGSGIQCRCIADFIFEELEDINQGVG